MRLFSRRLVAGAALALPLVLTSLSAPAAGAALLSWTGTATTPVDGDTNRVDVAGDSTGALRIRNAGIQAMEIGECHAAEATARLKALTANKPVRLSAERASSSSQGRSVRFVDVRNRDGSYTDVQLQLLREGHVLWLVDLASEDSRAQQYHLAMEQAAVEGKNLWDDDYCGSGPQQKAKIKLWVNYDANGSDPANINGEYVRILNQSTGTLDLSGWWLRDSSHDRRLTFAKGTTVGPGKYLTVRVGKGTHTTKNKYWGFDAPMFSNESAGVWGDDVFLFDPQGDLRKHISYPCVFRCSDPRQGQVKMSVLYDAPGNDHTNINGEYLEIRPAGSTPLDLSYTVLELSGRIAELPTGTVVNPGETLRIHPGQGTQSRLRKYWQDTRPLMSNSGGQVVLRTTEGLELACQAWADGHCS